jgi:hypothetical protein
MADIAETIINMEQAALERWAAGDPSGFLEICDPEVVYFDPFQEQRIDGLPALAELYESIRGDVHLDDFELLNPKVQVAGDAAAVLTFNFIGRTGDTVDRWNCTEVYRNTPQGWRILQTHWSFTKPVLATT